MPELPSEPAPAGAHGGVIRQRTPWLARLNAWRKRTPLNPYWIERGWLHRAAARLAPFSSGVLLDVGAAERPYEKLFTPHVERYLGLEYPPVADNLIPEIWNKLHTIRHLIDVFGDGMRLPFRDRAVDTVLSFEVLEHVPDPDACVREFARVLRPGGRVLLTVPFVAPLHQLPFDFYRYTPRGVEVLLERHGLELELCEARGNFPAAVGAALSHYLLRSLASRRTHHDGSVELSRWRYPLTMPLIALEQLAFAGLARLSRDESLTLGYVAVARRRGDGPRGG
jgi:SAM-dependent methyltransferase